MENALSVGTTLITTETYKECWRCKRCTVTNVKTSELHNEATTMKHARVTLTSKIRKPAL